VDAGGRGFAGELTFGEAGSTGCFGAEELTDAGGMGFGDRLGSGEAASTGCFGAEELTDAGGPDFDGEPYHATTA